MKPAWFLGVISALAGSRPTVAAEAGKADVAKLMLEVQIAEEI